MPLTEEQIDLLKATLPRLDTGAFYEHLRVSCPVTYDRFFRGVDMTIQRGKLTAAIRMVVMGASNFEALQSTLKRLGEQHAHIGVEPEHYEMVRQSLLHSLKLRSPAETVAWDTAIRTVISSMQQTQELPALDVHFSQDEQAAQPAGDSE